MDWYFLNTEFNTGKFNMDFDLHLASICRDEAFFRLYRWDPYCISLGANQNEDSINVLKANKDNIDVVNRPTGGRAILHSEEVTYSVIYPLGIQTSARDLYRQINLALKQGLSLYDPKLDEVELENMQPDFQQFYKEQISNICFASSAKSELKYKGKKLVGSAQRKLGSVILQHGSILTGLFHRKILDYMNIGQEDIGNIKMEMFEKTVELNTILNKEIDYDKLYKCLQTGFQDYFNIKFIPFENKYQLPSLVV